MSDTPQPWLGEVAPQSNAQTHAPADMGRILAQQQRPAAKPSRGYHRYRLPDSVTESMYWKGCEADLYFGIWEPTSGEVRKLVKSDAEFSDAAKNYIAAIGVPQQDGSIARGAVTEAEPEGEPVLADVTDNTAQVLPWWGRLSPKAQTLVTSMFVEFIMPTAEEGESLRASRQWVGG